jgi:hypothetical protein
MISGMELTSTVLTAVLSSGRGPWPASVVLQPRCPIACFGHASVLLLLANRAATVRFISRAHSRFVRVACRFKRRQRLAGTRARGEDEESERRAGSCDGGMVRDAETERGTAQAV